MKAYAALEMGGNTKKEIIPIGSVMEDKSNRCKGDHSRHICRLVVDRNKNLDTITEAVKNPKYICFNCARVAGTEEFLCNPMPL